VRGVTKHGRLLVQTLVGTKYDPVGHWHEIDGEYTTEGYRFKRYALKPFLTLRKLAADAAKVSAREAAKAEKADERADRVGLCPCCFGDFVVHRKGDKRVPRLTMVLHGYERPGHGYIVGDCHGHGFPPFEVSCEGTKSWLNQLHGILNYRREALRQLAICKDITVEIRVRRNFRTGANEIERKTIKRGDDGFERAIEDRRRELTSEIARVERDIIEYGKKIAEWAPQKWPRK